MKIFQSTELSRHPISEFEAATKFYVDQQVTQGAIVGGLFFTNIAPTSTGIVGSKSYVAGTTPANRVILEGSTDTDNVTVTLFAEGGSAFYSPTVTITTVPPQTGGPIIATLTEDPADKRSYVATANLTGITADTVVNASSSTNATASTNIVRAAAGPVMDVLTIGAYPGSQTAVKAGDTVTVTGRVANTATYAEIIAGGAAASLVSLTVGAADSFSTGFKTVSGTITISGLTGNQSITGRARNALGTFGGNFTSTNTILLDQVFPVIGSFSIAYPASQSGLKNTESATVTATVTNQSSIAYSGTNLTIASPTTYSASKTATLSGGTYSFGTNNYTITATKAANASVTVASTAVTIANVAPTAAITYTPAGRMASSPLGVSHTVTITANQRLLSAPSLVASSGTWQGAWTQGANSSIWTRVLLVADADPKGAQTFSSLVATGLAGLVGNTITSGAAYTVGGFATRTITFPAFAQFAPIGTNVVDFTKVTAAYTGSTILTRRTSTADFSQGFTITDATGTYDPTGAYLFITDAAFAGANTSGTLQLDIAEAA